MNGATPHPHRREGDSFAPAAEGELLLVPVELSKAIDIASGLLSELPPGGRWADRFVRALHDQGLILVPRAFAKTSAAVDANIYAMALAGKYALERGMLELQRTMGIGAGQRPLLADLDDGLAAVCGHAPPEQRERLVTVVEQLTRLHTLLGGAPLETPAPAADPLMTFQPPLSIAEQAETSRPGAIK